MFTTVDKYALFRYKCFKQNMPDLQSSVWDLSQTGRLVTLSDKKDRNTFGRMKITAMKMLFLTECQERCLWFTGGVIYNCHVWQQVRFCRINRRGKPFDHSCQKKSAFSWHLGVLSPSTQLGNDVFQKPGVGLQLPIEKINDKKCSSLFDGLMIFFFKSYCGDIEIL